MIILSNKLLMPSVVVKNNLLSNEARGLTVASQSNVFKLGYYYSSHEHTNVRRGNRRCDAAEVTACLTDWLSLMLSVWAKTWSWRFRAWIRSRVETFLPNMHAFFFQMHALLLYSTAIQSTPQTTNHERTAEYKNFQTCSLWLNTHYTLVPAHMSSCATLSLKIQPPV